MKFKAVKVDAQTVESLIEIVAAQRHYQHENEEYQARYFGMLYVIENIGLKDQYEKYISK